MGFFGGMKRLIMGEPVFQVENKPSTDGTIPPTQTEPGAHVDSTKTPVDASGRKIIPEVVIENVDCNRSAEAMSVWVTFKNTSNAAVFLDKIHVLGQTKELDFELAPGGARQLEIYKGALQTTDAYRSAELYYRLVSSGDYFQARFFVEPNYDDGFYFPEEFHLQRPIRDI